MTKNKLKIFILITDGVSLRNFAYTNFYIQAQVKGFEVVFWHNTPFNLETLGFNQLKLEHPKLHWMTTILKNVRKHIELDCYAKRNKDSIYYSYLFPLPFNTFKNRVKSILTRLLIFCFKSEQGLSFIRRCIENLEERTFYHKQSIKTLESHQPDLVYCTSQRSVLALAPMQAAKKLKIPTICFVYSWDNLPKATLDVTANKYHVWSAHMRKELLHFHPFINENQVTITGTPQFEAHYNEDIKLSRLEFYSQHHLNPNIDYICYSGDDMTTSPKDELYLRDVAIAMRKLNANGHKLGLIFRRCPVDFSDRYDDVLKSYKDVIVPIAPLWKKMGAAWDSILPMPEDLYLLANLAEHCTAVINLGSSMVFDFVAHHKPCFYINYNYLKDGITPELGVYIYDYVHFRSMPKPNAVCWLNNPETMSEDIIQLMSQKELVVQSAEEWFEKINSKSYDSASHRIVGSIEKIIQKID